MTVEREEGAVLEALESLEALDRVGQPERALDAEAREYLEVLGLLPYALDEEAARPELKGKIMDRINMGRIGEATSVPDAAPVEASDPAVDSRGGRRLDAAMRFQAADDSAPAAKGSSWTWALAAMLGVCLLGLTILTGRVQKQSELIADLQSQDAHGAGLPGPNANMHDQFELIRTIAPQVYPLQPSLNQPTPVNARGMIYVCPNHQRWYLSIKGLPPSPEGQEYRFWFMTEDGAVSAGRLNVESEAPIVLEAASMPAGTEGFTLTLESKEASEVMSEERIVLKADEAVAL